MADAAERPMTLDEFLDWAERQEIPYEFVDGKPVPKYPDDGTPYAMAGGTADHHTIQASCVVALRARRPAGCRIASDARVELMDGSTRIPDVVMTCLPPVKDARHYPHPSLIVEVTSPTTADIDKGAKADAYRQLASLMELWLVDSTRRAVTVWQREGDAWLVRDIIGQGEIPSGALGAPVPLAELYEDTAV